MNCYFYTAIDRISKLYSINFWNPHVALIGFSWGGGENTIFENLQCPAIIHYATVISFVNWWEGLLFEQKKDSELWKWRCQNRFMQRKCVRQPTRHLCIDSQKAIFGLKTLFSLETRGECQLAFLVSRIPSSEAVARQILGWCGPWPGLKGLASLTQ